MPERHWRPSERLVWGGTCGQAPGVARTRAGTAVSTASHHRMQGCTQGQLGLEERSPEKEGATEREPQPCSALCPDLSWPLPCACVGKLQRAWRRHQQELKRAEATWATAKYRNGARADRLELTASQQKISPCLRKSAQSIAFVTFDLQHQAHTQKSLLVQRNKKMRPTVKIQGCQWSR